MGGGALGQQLLPGLLCVEAFAMDSAAAIAAGMTLEDILDCYDTRNVAVL